MKNRFVKITLILSMLLVMAVPAQVFAAEKSCSPNQSKVNSTNCSLNQSNCNLNQFNCNSNQSNCGLNQSKVNSTNCSKIYNQVSQDAVKQFQEKLSQFSKCNIDSTQFQNLVNICRNKAKAPANETPAAPAKPEAPATPAEPETPAAPTTPAQDPDSSASLAAYEQQVVDLVNKERAAAGLSALKVNTKLAGVAEKKAEDLRDNNYFSHTSPTYGSPFDMMKQFGITYSSAGENIAKGQKTPESVMNGWMNSAGHKANILNSSFTEIGVGYVTDSNGNTYWVQMFIRP